MNQFSQKPVKTGATYSDQDSQQTALIDPKSNSLRELDSCQSETQLGGDVPIDELVPRKYLSVAEFHQFGISIADWARAHDFNVRLVYSVVRGERKCLRGASYQIAKELGMK